MRYHLLSLILFTISVTAVAQAQEAVFLIRHAEQMHDVEDPPLTDDGLNRAKAWASIFRDAGIDVIYTSKKVRTKQTGASIADELGLPLKTMSRRDVTGLVNQIRKEHSDDVVLIISHSKIIPKLLEAFVPVTKGPVIGNGDYDNLFVIVPKGEDDATVLRLRY
jgi:2,3-bisphosphoglycerate-dependent phosphoglycerate mutase